MESSLVIYNETNIYILSKLVALVRRETGKRHRLSSQETITALIQAASISTDDRIQSYYRRFLENLTPEQMTTFKQAGIQIPESLDRKPGLLPSGQVRPIGYSPVKTG